MARISALALVIILAIVLTTTARADVMYRLTSNDINRVYDGDTLYVDIQDLPQFIGQDIGIRIRGIDAPEMRSRCDDETVQDLERDYAVKARDHLRRILKKAAYFDIVQIEMGSFSRLVADIQLPNDKSLAQVLVGHRWIHRVDAAQQDWCTIIRNRQ